MKKYKLIKEYPNHLIGDIVIYDSNITPNNFIWEKEWGQRKYCHVPKDFQPDVTPNWFEEIMEKKIFIMKSYDNVDLFIGGTYYCVHKSTFAGYPSGIPQPQILSKGTISESHVFFAKIENAKQYILENKPLFSIKDLKELRIKENFYKEAPPEEITSIDIYISDLEKSAKQKLGGE